MPQFDITSPDGKKFRITAPEGATQEQVLQYAQSQMPSNPGSLGDNGARWGALDNFSSGVLQGMGDEVKAAGAAAKESLSGGLPFGEAYDQAKTMYQGAREKYKKENPVQSLATDIGGQALPWVIASPLMGVAAPATMTGKMGVGGLTGGGMGGVSGFLNAEGDLMDRLKGAGKGAAIGGVIGAVTPPIVEGVSKLGKALYGQIADRLPLNQPTAAARKLAEALERDGMTPTDALARIQEMGPRAALLDTGPNVRSLARSAATVPGEGKTMISDFLTQRQEGVRGADKVLQGGQTERVTNLLDDLVPEQYRGTMDDLLQRRASEATPLYDRAFSGGSAAPFEDEFRRQLTSATGAKGQIAKQIAQIGRDSAGALASRGAAGREIRDRYMQLHKELENADTARNALLDLFNRAKADGSANAPGAVWNPRIQQFLDDPIMKGGISRGLEIQRLEALAAGRPFNPSEYAIVGSDQSGKPVVGAVPNMRLLDSAKKGLDAIIQENTDAMTGRVNEFGRAVTQVKKSFLDQLDTINPEYANARASYAGASKLKSAMELGRSILGGKYKNADEVAASIANFSPDELNHLRIGAVQELRDRIGNLPNRADATKRLMDIPSLEQKIRLAFGDDAVFKKYISGLEGEKAMFDAYSKIMGGSRTGEVLAEQADSKIDPSRIMQGLKTIASANPLDWLRGSAQVLGGSKDRLLMPASRSKELAKLLTGTDLGPIQKQIQIQELEAARRAALSRALTASAAPGHGQ